MRSRFLMCLALYLSHPSDICPQQPIVAFQREAQLEPLSRLVRHLAVPQILPSGSTEFGIEQLGPEELDSPRIDLGQIGPARLRGARRAGITHFDPHVVGEDLHRFHERDILTILDEREDIAALAAAEALEGAVIRPNGERGRLFAVKRAQANPPLAAALQPYMVRDDIENVDPVEYLAFYKFEVVQRGGKPQSGKL